MPETGVPDARVLIDGLPLPGVAEALVSIVGGARHYDWTVSVRLTAPAGAVEALAERTLPPPRGAGSGRVDVEVEDRRGVSRWAGPAIVSMAWRHVAGGDTRAALTLRGAGPLEGA